MHSAGLSSQSHKIVLLAAKEKYKNTSMLLVQINTSSNIDLHHAVNRPSQTLNVQNRSFLLHQIIYMVLKCHMLNNLLDLVFT